MSWQRVVPDTVLMQLSVIIPALNEARRIGETIAAVRQCGACEVIVVDGGSDDDTLAAAAAADVCLSAARGRGVQQNAGAAVAGGDVLFFLHADCWPEAGAFAAIEAVLRDERTVGGCFAQRIDAPGLAYRLLERGNAARVRLTKWVYGDQGLFVRRAAFVQAGRFPEVALMEDLLLAKRLKRVGRIRLVAPPIHVSPRRWQQTGVVRQTLRNWAFLGLTHCGVPPAKLARRYADIR